VARSSLHIQFGILRILQPIIYCHYYNDHRKAVAIACLPAKAGIMKRFEFAAREHQRNSHYQLWTLENHAVELLTPAFTQQKLDYIHNNLVRAGIVEKP
jgi:hypothetical protein